MHTKETLIDSVAKRLVGVVRLPHQACNIAFDIFLLLYKFNLSTDSEVHGLLSTFLSNLREWGLDDLLVRQVNYALRIAESKGDLEYEEMHKLLSLCDEIYVLEYLGLEFDPTLKQQYEQALCNRFHRERHKAKLAAEDKYEDWKKGFWWYKENLEI